MLRAVVFDLDGTLLDTIPDIAGALNRALAAQGLPTHPVRTCAGFVGGGIREAVKKAAPPDASEETLQAILDGYRGDYVAHCTEKTACYPGVPELLEGLVRRGLALGVLRRRAPCARSSGTSFRTSPSAASSAGPRTGP